MNFLDGYQEAYRDTFEFHDENLAMLAWYASRVTRKITPILKPRVLSLGIGHQIVAKSISEMIESHGGTYEILEGSSDIIKNFIEGIDLPKNVSVTNCYFEKYEPGQKFDVIEMGFVLEHVHDPLFVLTHFKKHLKKHGIIFIAVPNAKSLHRLIGNYAGLLDNCYKLSEADLKLGHQRYFDYHSLKALILEAGLKPLNVEGIYLKPFTTEQLRSLQLPKKVAMALFEIGVVYPELSNAICFEAGL